MKRHKKLLIYDLESSFHSIELNEYLSTRGMDIVDLFTSGSDKVKIDNVEYYFQNFELDDILIIVYLNVDYQVEKPVIENILCRFFSHDYLSFFEKQDSVWSEFKNNCIAFRNNEGATYTIWKYKG